MMMLVLDYSQLRLFPRLLGVSLVIACSAESAQVRVAARTEEPVPAALSAAGKHGTLEGPIRGPVLGYVFDSSALRVKPLLGIPGASYVGAPLQIDFTPRFVEVSPNQQLAVGAETGSGDVFLIDLRTTPPSTERLIQVGAAPDRAFFSPLGKAVAFYHRESGHVEIVTGLPGASGSVGQINLGSMPGMLTALAVSDDGKALAVAASVGDQGSLFVAAPGEDPRLVVALGRASALAFLNGVQDLLVADSARNEIVRVRNVKAAAEWTLLASRRDGIRQPVAVAASRDNTTAFAVDASNRSVARIPLNGGTIDFVGCPCAPTGLHALAGGSVFRLTSASSTPMYLLDAQSNGGEVSSQPRVLFVPAPGQAPSAGAVDPSRPRGRARR